MGSGCLDEQMVVAFLGGDMAARDRQLVEAHLDTCSACTELTTWAASDLAHRSRETGGDDSGPFIGALAPGSRIDRYQILGGIGRGGMGEVYAAYHPDLDRRIALKVVGGAGGDSALRRARLLREARAIARLSHPNVITVYDAGTFGDRVYIAMEFVEGTTVDGWLRAGTRSWRDVVDVFVAAGRGLAAAHAAGVVHRDFKPQNVMIGRDGAVRVMDFGLARLAAEPADPAPEAGGDDGAPERPPPPATVTKTGALVGTIAYMPPEQFRGEPIDARADQFSFCVALHEAIYGRRPALRHLAAPITDATSDGDGGGGGGAGAPAGAAARAEVPLKSTTTARSASSPAWLRGVVARGLSEQREHRFPSMDALLAAMTRAQTRVRARTVGLLGGVAIALLTAGAWRLGSARHVTCAVPKGQLAAVWAPGDEASPRRQAIHRAFAATGAANAETAWRRVAAALDEYAGQWSAMYVDACEATHVRGDQTSEMLALRMNCLDETLDGVRALTEVLSQADAAIVGQAATAAQNLVPVKQCAAVAALRSAVPVPRDAATTRAVLEVRRALRDANAFNEVGDEKAALARARALLARAEAAHYKPLVAEVLYRIGYMQSDGAPAEAEVTLEEALDAAESARDDVTAAKAAIGLVYATSYAPEKRHECEQWTRLAHAILDRLPPPQHRLRAWLLNNEAGVLIQQRDFAGARPLLERSLALKQRELGESHPDVVRTTINLVWALNELGQPAEAIKIADRGITIVGAYDGDSILLAFMLNNRGDSLNALARHAEAERDYSVALRIIRAQYGDTSYRVAVPLIGIATAKLGEGDRAGAVDRLEEALALQTGHDPDALLVADTQLALARALGPTAKDRARARTLASAAERTYATHDERRKQHDAADWLAGHGGSGKP